MHKLAVVFCLILLASPVIASEDIYPYVGVTFGAALTSINKISDSSGSLNTDFNPAYIGGLNVGICFDPNSSLDIDRIRVEAEARLRSSTLNKMSDANGQSADMDGTLSIKDYMLNIYLEKNSYISKDRVRGLFLVTGIGAATASISSIYYQGKTVVKSSSNTQLAYQVGLGAGFDVTNDIALDATYKYMGTTAFQFAGITANYGSHNILIGARYSFK